MSLFKSSLQIALINKEAYRRMINMLNSYGGGHAAERIVEVILKEYFKKITIDWFKENWDNIEKSVSFSPGVSSAVRDMNIL